MPEINATKLAQAAPEKKYQHYAYSKAATQLITPLGKKFCFVNHQLVTDDKEIIEYLDAEIEAGIQVITKGALLSAKESDPMRVIKEKAVEDYKREQAELAKNNALGIKADMGSTKPKHERLNTGNTDTIVAAAGSTSNNAAVK